MAGRIGMAVLSVSLVIVQCGCGKPSPSRSDSSSIERKCTMDGNGSGSCNFTNMGDSEATLCGAIVVSYRPTVKESADTAIARNEMAKDQLSKKEKEKQAVVEAMKRMQPQFDKAMASATIRMETYDESMALAMRGLPAKGPRPSMSPKEEERLIGQQQQLLVKSFDLDEQLRAAKKNLADAAQKADRATALKLGEAVAKSGTICSGTLSPRSTSTIKFDIPEVREQCDMRWMGLKNWTDACRFDFSPVE